jgi:hypothetical protein
MMINPAKASYSMAPTMVVSRGLADALFGDSIVTLKSPAFSSTTRWWWLAA